MVKKIWSGMVLSLALFGVAEGMVIDAPHNEANGIRCGSCHTYSLWWKSSPSGKETVPSRGEVATTVCLQCHDRPNDPIPLKKPHSSASFGEIAQHAVWSTHCVDCHDPHFQAQVDWATTNGDDLYLVKGTIGPAASFVANADGTTTFAYTLGGAAPLWASPETWSHKSGAGRGLILVDNLTAANNTWSVVGATATTITVQGVFRSTAATHSFGLIYGQLVKSRLTTPSGQARTVKFFDPNQTFTLGGFTDPRDPAEGICQVCHTATKYWRGDGQNADPATGKLHNPTIVCTACHTTASGFKPSGGPHTFLGETPFCVTCHPAGDILAIHRNDCRHCHTTPPTLADPAGKSLVTTIVRGTCQDCHGGKAHDSEAAHDHRKTVASCGSCHAVATAAAIDALHKQECGTCHGYSGTKLDATVVANAIATGRGVSGTDVDCQTCHPVNHDTSAAHDQRQTVALCATCHAVANAAAVDTLHHGCGTCHGYSGTLFDATVVAGAIATGKGPNGTAVNCQTCHSTYFNGHRHRHLVALQPTDLSQAAPGKGCFTCHNDAGQGLATWSAILTEHRNQCATCHTATRLTGNPAAPTETVQEVIAANADPTPCLACHWSKKSPATHGHTGSDFSWAGICNTCHAGANIVADVHGNKCALCHANPAGGDYSRRVGVDGDATLAGISATASCTVCHDPTLIPTGGIHHDTATAANNGCTACHPAVDHTAMVAGAEACTACHAGTVATASGAPVSLTDAKVHDSCRTCHTFDANLRGILVDFSGRRGVIGSGTLPDGATIGGRDGGGTCTVCHTAPTVATFHHTSPRTAVGQCEACHVDPRPNWPVATLPGDNGGASGLPRPTQMACVKCHVSFSGTAMTVTKFQRGDYSSYRRDWTRSTAHVIPMTATRINNYGICLSCHYLGSTKVPASAQVTLWHAHPSRFGGTAWTFYNQTAGGTTGKTYLRGSGSYANGGDKAHYAPGRSKKLVSDLAPQSLISGFNIFAPNYGITTPAARNSSYKSNGTGMDRTAFNAQAYDTQAFYRIAIPDVPQIGGPADATLNATTRAVPVFASLAPLTGPAASAADEVRVASAIFDGSALTVVAGTSNPGGCATLVARYGTASSTMAGTSPNCTATLVNPLYPASGLGVDVVTGNSSGVDVLGYRISNTSAADVRPSKRASLWYTTPEVTFSNASGFGAGGVQYYRYAWDQQGSHLFSDSETEWSSGTLIKEATATGSWYLHLRGYDANGVALATLTHGPFNYDPVPPQAGGLTPAAGADNSKVNANLTFTLSDADGGVDWGSLQVQLAGSKGYAQGYTSLDSEVVSQVGTPANYAVTVNPQTDFGLGETMTVTVQAKDRAGNDLAPTSWSFTTTDNQAPRVEWTGEPGYTTDGVSPDRYAGGTFFDFRVKYSDAEGAAPTAIQLWIDKNNDGDFDEADERVNLTPEEVEDIDYADGKLYSSTTTIVPYVPGGKVSYRFHAADDTAADVTGSATAVKTVEVADPKTVCASGCEYDSIPLAIADAGNGDYILVADGTYSQKISFGGKAITLTSVNGAASTIIQGDGSNAAVVTCNSGEGATSVLEGFTIHNQAYNSATRGIVISNGSPTIRSCQVLGNSGNSSFVDGPGIHITGANSGATIQDSTISTNFGKSGAGIYFSGSSSGTLSISNCRISGNSTNTGFGGAIYLSGITKPTTISGTTITNNTSRLNGGAIWSNAPLSIVDSTIDHNTISSGSSGQGGGLYLNGSLVEVTNSSISNNSTTAGGGGGIMAEGSTTLSINGCTINGNLCRGNLVFGGGLYLRVITAATIARTNIRGNQAHDGGGLYVNSGATTISNSTITGNLVEQYVSGTPQGGGLFVATAGTTVDLLNTTLVGNYALHSGGGMRISSGAVTVKNSIIWGNSGGATPNIYGAAAISYSDVEGGGEGIGNLNSDPGLVDPRRAVSGLRTAEGDFHLQSGSPMVDRGTDEGAPADDIDGNPRPLGIGVDMGSDEKE